ncbi:unnamed protein product, partial [Candidula unifasciata]
EPTTGKITVIRSLSQTKELFFLLRIVAIDLGEKSDEMTVNVSVNRNLFAPYINPLSYIRIIPETFVLGDSVVEILASDLDQNGPWNSLSFLIVSDSTSLQYFYIDNSGIIRLKQSLVQTTQNEFHMLVRVSDQGDPPNIAPNMANVTVYVTKNVYNPIFFNETYSLVIPENQPVSSVLFTLTAGDNDTEFNKLTYFVEGDLTAPQFFGVNPNTGAITVTAPLTQTGTNFFTLRVGVIDNGAMPRRAYALVFIRVTRNFGPPYFISNQPNQATIPENAAPGFSVMQVSAKDDDVTITLVATDRGNPALQSLPFTVTVRTIRNLYPPVWVGEPYVFNIIPPFTEGQVLGQLIANDADSFYAYVEDNGSPPMSDIALVTVNANRNNRPSYPQTNVAVTIPASTDPGTLVAQCNATDSDSPNTPNGQVTHSQNIVLCMLIHIFLLFARNIFRVLENGGVVLQRELIQDKSTSIYTVLIKARDNSAFPLEAAGTCTVAITVYSNQAPPQFIDTPYDRVIERTAPAGLVIVDTNTTDADTSAPFNVVTYAIIRQPEPPIFAINSTTGAFSLTSNVASQSSSSYTIVISATDGGGLTTYNLFTITVNQNLNAPVITNPGANTNYTVTVEILETHSFSQIVYQVQAVDQDQGLAGKLIYTLTGTPLGQQYFQMNSDTGAITLRSSLLSDASLQYILTVTVQDSDLNPKQAVNTGTVIVTVYRNTYTPAFINENSYPKPVNQDLAVGQPVTQVAAYDSDRVGTYEKVTFDIVGDGQAAGLFRIDANTGVITLQSSLSGVSTNVIYLSVRASDNGTPPKTNITRFPISLNLNSRMPVWADPTNPSFNPSSPAYVFTINEDQILYQPFGRLSSTDADTSPPHNVSDFFYSPENQAALEYFRVTSQGEVSAIKSLVGVPADNYTWTMGLRDLGTPQMTNIIIARVTVFVIRNRYSPIIVNCPPAINTTVNDNAPVGTRLFQLTVRDDDGPRYGNVTVQLIGDDTATAVFTLDSQYYIAVSGNLASSSVARYQLRIVASDLGNPPRQTTCVTPVYVDHNLYTPVFPAGGFSARILEIAPVASNVLRLNATDADFYSPYKDISFSFGNNLGSQQADTYFIVMSSGMINVLRPLTLDTTNSTEYQIPFNQLTYQLVGETLALQYFSIDATGVITLRQSLVGGPSQIILTVRVCDGGNLCDQRNFYVYIQQNFNPPVFSANSYNVTIPETTPDPTAPYNQITYRMETTNVRFSIDSGNGSIRVSRALTGETEASFTFNIFAVDGGGLTSALIPVTVFIIRNGYSPLFSNATCDAGIQASVTVGSPVAAVMATDLDTQLEFGTSSIRYIIIGDDGAPNYFTIDSQSGQILAASGIGSSSTDVFRVRVEARDGGGKSAVKVCTITVTRNLNSPEFSPAIYSARILETYPIQASVLQVTITDADTSPPSNQGNFSLSGDALCLEYFQIQDYSGIISPRKDLRFNKAKPATYTVSAFLSWICTVTVTDRGVPPRSGTNTATATIAVVYNKAPSFNQKLFNVTISRTIQDGAPVASFTASDPDTDVGLIVVFLFCLYLRSFILYVSFCVFSVLLSFLYTLHTINILMYSSPPPKVP